LNSRTCAKAAPEQSISRRALLCEVEAEAQAEVISACSACSHWRESRNCRARDTDVQERRDQERSQSNIQLTNQRGQALRVARKGLPAHAAEIEKEERTGSDEVIKKRGDLEAFNWWTDWSANSFVVA